MLNESINGIVARLLMQHEESGSRVILISSAISGEGKTTFATQLASTLARAGQATLLVDFDLRRPAIDRLFDVPSTPGVADVMRGEADAEATVHPTSIANLSVAPAGQWRGDSLGVLANGTLHTLFDHFRAAFQFVVVDGAPVLPVADTRLIGQHADLVLLSVLRDVSRAPKVLAACEILTAFGARSLAAVVTGTAHDVYYKDSGPYTEHPDPDQPDTEQPA